MLPITSYFSRIKAIFSFASRDIIKSKIVLVLIITSLSIAFASVLLSASILGGFQQMLIDQAKGYLSHLVIRPADDQESIPMIRTLKQRLALIANVQAFSIRSDLAASVKYKEKVTNPYRTIGIDTTNERQTSELANHLVAGQFVSSRQPDAVVIGLTLADFLVGLDYDNKRIAVGEEISVTTETGQEKKYRVGGIIDAKTFLPNLFLILPKNELENLAGRRADSEIVVKLKDERLLEKTRRDIEDAHQGIEVVTWQQEAGYVNDIIRAVAFIIGLINALLTISVFIIMSIIIFINVFQKRRQIGIIKSMGATNSFVISIYMVETVIYVILSYILGFSLFWVLHQYSAYHPVSLLIGDFHTVFQIQTMWLSLITLTVAAVGGSIIPTQVAARTKVVDVIRDSV